MIPNYNEDLGIRYGVIARCSPDVFEDIVEEGRNISYEDAREEAISYIAGHLEDAKIERAEGQSWQELCDEIVRDDAVGCLSGVPAYAAEEAYHEIFEGEGADVQVVAEELLDSLDVEWDWSENVYLLENDECHLPISHLGGAPLITVLYSRYATIAPSCSPCVPGAGDLDSVHHGEGTLTLCLPPDLYRLPGTDPFALPPRIFRINDHGTIIETIPLDKE